VSEVKGLKGKRIDHVGIVIDDLASARRFAADVLGLQLDREVVIPGRLNAAFFRCGDASVEFIEVTDPQLRERRLGDAQARVEHVAIEVDEAFEARDELRELGVEMTEDQPTVSGQARSFFTRPETADGVIYQLFDRRGSSPTR
jgi:methylmalonyl-CoA/ethylmalonyl-CoA epimerase